MRALGVGNHFRNQIMLQLYFRLRKRDKPPLPPPKEPFVFFISSILLCAHGGRKCNLALVGHITIRLL
jgi:hypothetical protein